MDESKANKTWRAGALIAGIVSALFSFWLQFAVAARGGNRFVDILFDLDMALMLHPFHLLASYRHPVLPAIFHIPASVFGYPLEHWFGMAGPAARELVLHVEISAISGMSSALLVLILQRLGIPALGAGLIAAIDLLSPSQVFAGNLLDSFAVTCFCLRLCIWLCTIPLDFTLVRHQLVFFAVGVLSIGTTLTNGALWGLCYLYLAFLPGKTEWWKPMLKGTAVGAAAVVTAFATLLLAAPFVGFPVRDMVGSVLYTMSDGRRYEHPPSVERTARIQQTFVHAFLATTPGLRPILTVDAASLNKATFPAMTVHYDGPDEQSGAHWVQSGALLGLLAFGVVGLWNRGGLARFIAASSAAWLAINFVLHNFWGSDDLFLYCLHWQTLTVVWMAGLYWQFQSRRTLVAGALGAMLLFQVWTTPVSLRETLLLLERAHEFTLGQAPTGGD